MGFIRIKEISKKNGNNNEIKKYNYAYYVENKWRKRLKGKKKGSRQSLSKYIGKIIELEKIKDCDFCQTNSIDNFENYLKDSTKERIICDLIKTELYQLGFSSFEKNEYILKNNDIYFDSKSFRFVNQKGKEEKLVIKTNEGFFCKYTATKLIKFKPEKGIFDEREIGIELAKAFLEAGLKVPKEVFVAYFEKV